jgi:uncharacterized membrane protein YfcA
VYFPVSGVECSPLLPPLVAFAIAILTTPAGLSGAFLLLPFQMSVLGFVSPAVTPTNLLYNVVASPGGVFRYIREGRMAWPLALTVTAGTLPGIFAGALIRIRYLPDPSAIKLFAGLVLLYLGARLLYGFIGRRPLQDSDVPQQTHRSALPAGAVVSTRLVSLRRIEYEFLKETFSFRPIPVLGLALIVGLIGGIYGIGGGAIIAPFLVSILGLPVYTVAGAALFGTLLTSAAGVAFFEMLGVISFGGAAAIGPDWTLGALFGIGGLFGTYFGARLRLALLIMGLSINYIWQFFF